MNLIRGKIAELKVEGDWEKSDLHVMEMMTMDD